MHPCRAHPYPISRYVWSVHFCCAFIQLCGTTSPAAPKLWHQGSGSSGGFGGARLDTSAAWPFSLVDAALVIFCRVYTLGAQESIRFNNYWREKSGESGKSWSPNLNSGSVNEGKKVSVAECCKYFVQIRESGNSNVFEGNPLWDLEHRKASEHCKDPQFEESKRLMTDNFALLRCYVRYIYIFIFVWCFVRYHDFPENCPYYKQVRDAKWCCGPCWCWSFPYDAMLLDLAWTIALTPRWHPSGQVEMKPLNRVIQIP